MSEIDNKTEQALRASENRFRSLLETASIAIIVIDGSGKIVMVNSETERTFGFSREELIGSSVDILLPERLRAVHGSHRNTFFANPHARSMGLDYDLLGMKKDGTEFPIEVGLSHIEMDNSTLAMSFIVDISERKQAQLEREQLIVDLESYAHTVAHDLKNPLSLTLGYANMLAGNLGEIPTEKAEEFLAEIIHSANKMHRIIDELLLLARVRRLDAIMTEPLIMGLIVKEALAGQSSIVDEHKAEIIMPEDNTWPVVLGYAAWVEEVWANYISNAIKYGGAPPHIELGATVQDNDMVRFWVRDDGSGLSAEEQERLFTKFTRLDDARAQGHGLGLSIVKRIVEKLGGEVGVESVSGQGSIFSFTLPISK